MENNLKVFTLPIEEFEKKYPVNCSIEVPGIPKGHVAKIASMLRFIRLNLLKFRIWISSRLSILSKCSQSLVILNNLDGQFIRVSTNEF